MKKLLSVLFLLSFTLASVYAQNIQVKGTVVSGSDNEPLPGVNVVVKGTTNGGITDLDGNFTLSVPADATLSITYIGFKSQEVAVNGKNSLKIVLQEDSETLDEVVVVGYGVQKKSVVTASIAKVSSEDLENKSPVRMDNALKGLAAGVDVTSASAITPTSWPPSWRMWTLTSSVPPALRAPRASSPPPRKRSPSPARRAQTTLSVC